MSAQWKATVRDPTPGACMDGWAHARRLPVAHVGPTVLQPDPYLAPALPSSQRPRLAAAPTRRHRKRTRRPSRQGQIYVSASSAGNTRALWG
eukprot:180525-Chlamydomonas_euryale.AAC.9